MQQLSISRINAIAPYETWAEEKGIAFVSDYGVRINVSFDEDKDILLTSNAFWFNITNVNDKPSPRDPKMMPTIWSIIEEFFRVNPDVLLYICDTAGNQQAMRARLFHRWFTAYGGNQDYMMKQVEIADEGVINYVAMIVQRSNPDLLSIEKEFDAQARLFTDKP